MTKQFTFLQCVCVDKITACFTGGGGNNNINSKPALLAVPGVLRVWIMTWTRVDVGHVAVNQPGPVWQLQHRSWQDLQHDSGKEQTTHKC